MIAASIAAALLAAAQAAPEPRIRVALTGDAPLLDGACGDIEWAGAARTAIGNGTVLLAQQEGDSLHLCILLPPDSLGTLDLYLQGGDGRLHNLHSSAQVGERVRSEAGWPEWRFGNHVGWFSPPVPFTGMTERDGKRVPVFGEQASREIVIRKSRFGLANSFRMMLQVRALGSNRNGGANFPTAASENDPATWAEAALR